MTDSSDLRSGDPKTGDASAQARRKADRLRRRSEFDRVYNDGTALRSGHVVLVYAPNQNVGLRSAVVASRKVGSSVVRNRAKRLLRESVRALVSQCERTAIDIVLVARRGLNRRHVQQVTEEVGGLFDRAGIVRTTSP